MPISMCPIVASYKEESGDLCDLLLCTQQCEMIAYNTLAGVSFHPR